MTYYSKQTDAAPLVSVLCRTVGRETLRQSLESVDAQDWPHLELILVDALNQGREKLPIPELRSNLNFRVISDQRPLDRPSAGNAALDAAQGDFLIFLDDDDWIAPQQISQLIQELSNHPDSIVCYSVARIVNYDGTATDDIIAVPFDRTVLRRDNFIPIHAALFRRTLLDLGCRFDESLAIYEDWDFWLQAAEHGDFHLCSYEGAYYRLGGDSQTSVLTHSSRYNPQHPAGQGRARLLHKWRNHWSGQDWSALLGLVDQNDLVIELQAALRLAQQQVGDLEEKIRIGLREYQELESDQLALSLANDQLRRDIRSMLASFSWRITAPYRWVRVKSATLTARITQLIIAPRPIFADKTRGRELHADILTPPTDDMTFSDIFTLQGWAWSDSIRKTSDSCNASKPVHSCAINVVIDGEVLHHLQFPESRTIENAEDARRVGFATRLDIRHLEPGRHVLALVVTDSGDNSVTIKRTFIRQEGPSLYRYWRVRQPAPPELVTPLPSTLNIVLNLYGGCDARALQGTIDSLANLKGDNWRVFVNTGVELAQVHQEGEQRFSEIQAAAPLRVRQRLESMTPNTKISDFSGELLMFLVAGEKLSSDYLTYLALYWRKGTQLVYSDYDHYSEHDCVHAPVFTFAWSPDLLRSRDYIGGVFVLKAETLIDWPACHHSAWRYACLLGLSSANEPLTFSSVVRIPKILWSKPELAEIDAQAYHRALQEALCPQEPGIEIDSPAVQNGDPFCNYVRWPLKRLHKVSIIIPTTGNLRFLKPCLESLSNTNYPDIELIILDNSRGKNPDGIQLARDHRALVIDCNEPFNWSKLNNIGASSSSGEILLFLNDDVEIIEPQWLTEMVRQVVRDDVGTVGSLLLYPNGAIQHAGVFLVDHGGGARHLFHRQLPGEGVYLQLDQCVREVSANTGACLMILRDRFDRLGRFDESLALVGNDIDLCLRALEAGWRNVWTPHSKLIHHESVSRQSKPISQDEKAMWQRWEHRFRGGDPWFNPSLSLKREDCMLEENISQAVTRSNEAGAKASAPGVNLIAYIRASMGVGEAARGNAAALEAAGVDFGIINYERGNPSRMDNLHWQHREVERPLYDINLVHINADHIASVMSDLGHKWFRERYNIGFWAWEMPDFPDRWVDAFRLVNEVWVPSTYVNQAIATKSPVPVVTIPHAVQIDMRSAVRYGRSDFDIPQSPFVFISMFDTHSIAQRKNPFGSIYAFQKAFSSEDDRVLLVIKINNTNDDSLRALRQRIGSYRNIKLIDQHLDRSQIYSLINSCDCYVSLHHAEGFGLGPAEAMAMGKVALLTNWSGNTEYMTADNCIPVPYTLSRLDTDYGPYEAYQHWASPDMRYAARQMQALLMEPSRVKIIGDKAKAHMQHYFSAEAIGRRMRARLDSIRTNRHL